MYLDRDDYRGIFVFLSFVSFLAALGLGFRSLDLPAGSYFIRGYRIWQAQIGIPELKLFIPLALAASLVFGFTARILGRK